MSGGYIDWRSSAAKAIILRDLEPDGQLFGMDHLPAETVFEFYRGLPGFENVVFDQFKKRLADHRTQSARDRRYAERDAEACRVDRLVHPRNTSNSRGELVFDLHPAKRFVRRDVANGIHKTMSPLELQVSRPAYREFSRKIFKHRIYQEVRRQKFLHWLEIQRNKDLPKQNQPPTSTDSHMENATELAQPMLPTVNMRDIKVRKRVE